MGKILGIVKKPVEPSIESEVKPDSVVAKKKNSSGKSKPGQEKVNTDSENSLLEKESHSSDRTALDEPVANVIEPQQQLDLYRPFSSELPFKAIGKISANIALNLDCNPTIHEREDNNHRACIIFEERKFPLYFVKGKLKQRQSKIEKFNTAIAESHRVGSPEMKLETDEQLAPNLEVIVYPVTEGDGDLAISSFSYRNLVTESNEAEYQFLKPNHFKLSGLWGSRDGQTYIQIQSKNLATPLNIPVNWDDCPIQLNPSYDIHISIEAVFNPVSGKLDYTRTLKKPSKFSSPLYRKEGVEYTPPILKGSLSTSLPKTTLNHSNYMTATTNAITGKLEIIIKISELPPVKTVENGLQYFEIDCGGRIVSVSVKPKMFKKLTDAQANFPMWVGAIVGAMGESTPTGFILENPNIQVFEKKAKAEAAPAE